tara:strand:- start:264 stop:917 length:654 start_codon:yes stop_codon:yes gene_type:complete
MSHANDTFMEYKSRKVLFVYDLSDSQLMQEYFPSAGVSISIGNEFSILGNSFQNKKKTSIEETTFKIGLSIEGLAHAQMWKLHNWWYDTLKLTDATSYVWIPSFRENYQVSSVAGDNITLTLVDNHNAKWHTSEYRRHVAIWAGGISTGQPVFREIVSATSTQIVLDSAVTSMGTSTYIMDLYHCKFYTDVFRWRLHNRKFLGVDLEFLEDMVNTPT